MARNNRNTRRHTPERMKELDRIARQAPKSWRGISALRRAGFTRVVTGLDTAIASSRLRRLARQMFQARRRARLTQAQVARRMGTTTSAISRMESNNPGNLTLGTLERYAAAVGADLRYSLVPND